MNFIYITTNLINGKQYVGSHMGDPNDSYLGSGRPCFLNAVKKYGKSNFKREILEECLPEENLILETNYIKKYNTLVPYGYNISPTGGHGINGGKLAESTKQKISKANKGQKRSKETKKKISDAQKSIIGEDRAFYGKKHTLESKQKISESNKGKLAGEKHHYYKKKRKKETCEKIAKTLTGKKTPEEVKKKLKDASKNVKKIKCDHCNKEFTPWGLKNHTKALLKKKYIN